MFINNPQRACAFSRAVDRSAAGALAGGVPFTQETAGEGAGGTVKNRESEQHCGKAML